MVSNQTKRAENPYQDVLGVFNGGDNSGSNHKLFPGLGDVDNVNSLIVTFVHVWSHQAGAVLSAKVDLIRVKRLRKYLGGKHEGDVLFFCL